MTIYTPEQISETELTEFVRQQNGGSLPNGGPLSLYISEQNKYIWIDFDEFLIENFENDDELKEDHQIIRQKLGGKPQTGIIVEISSEPGSEQLAHKFAAAFARKWNAVISNSPKGFYSTKELFELEKAA